MNKLPILLATLGLAATSTTHAQNTPWPASGNVGIGTTSPTLALTVKGPNEIADFQSTAASSLIYFTPSLGCHRWVVGAGNVNVNDFGIRDVSASATRLSIDGAGNVGIGTTNPLFNLDVKTGTDEHFLIRRGACWGGANTGIAIDARNDAESASIPLRVRASVISLDGNVGIGTTNPAAQLHVAGSGTLALSMGWYGGHITDENGRTNFGWEWDQTNGNKTIVQSSEGSSQMLITQLHGIQLLGGNVGIGTTNPSEKLAVNGKIRAKEVIVETAGWSDYVFADGYKLQSLADVETQIKTNKHLPGVPSAQEVAEKGVSLGDMQALLLAKIEELTLHVIRQEKAIGALQNTVQALKTENTQLKAQTQ